MATEDFARIIRHPQIGQVVAFMEEEDGTDVIKYFFSPPRLGVCSVQQKLDGSDEAYEEARTLFYSDQFEPEAIAFLNRNFVESFPRLFEAA